MKTNTLGINLSIAETLILLMCLAEESQGKRSAGETFETTHTQGDTKVTRTRNMYGQFISNPGQAIKERVEAGKQAIVELPKKLKENGEALIADLDKKYDTLSQEAKAEIDKRVGAGMDFLVKQKESLVGMIKDAPDNAKKAFDGVCKAIKDTPGNISKKLKSAADSAVDYAKNGDIKGDARRFAADVFYNVTSFAMTFSAYVISDAIAAVEIGVVAGVTEAITKKPINRFVQDVAEMSRSIQIDHTVVPAVREITHPAIQKISDLIRGEEKEYKYNWIRDGYMANRAAIAVKHAGT